MTPPKFNEPIYVTRPMLGELDLYLPQMREIWASHILTNSGPKHNELEAKLCDTLDVPHVKLSNNGTVALITALKALGLTGEVITTCFTFPATVHAIRWAGLTPVFCDIDPVTMCIDPKQIEKLITPNTSAILGVHVYGIPCDVKAIQAIADKHQLKVVYDAAHAFKTTAFGKGIANYGDISMFSFHATKLFHTCEGGALAFRDPAIAKQIDLLKNFGIANENEVVLDGMNGKMNELQAAIGLVNLGLIEEEYSKREAIRATYIRELSNVDGIDVIQIPDGVFDSLQYMVIRVKPNCALDRTALYEQLKTYNVNSRKYFFPLCCDYECYRDLPSSHITAAREVVEEVLCLPFYGSLGTDAASQIAAIIRHVIAEASSDATRATA